MIRFAQIAALIGIFASVGFAQAADVTAQFFKDVQNERTKAIVDRMAPHVAAQVDIPVIEVLASAIRERLGAVERITTTGLTYKTTSEGQLSERTSKVSFAKGAASCRFATLNGRIVMFDVQSDQLGNWLKVPSETEIYRDLAARGLNEILMGDPVKSREMWHDAFKAVVSLDQLREMKQIIDTHLGEVKSIEFASETHLKGDTPGLRINFAIQAEKAPTTGHILIQFAGMKGHILGFNVSLPTSQ